MLMWLDGSSLGVWLQRWKVQLLLVSYVKILTHEILWYLFLKTLNEELDVGLVTIDSPIKKTICG
jgi:hypothetical protein